MRLSRLILVVTFCASLATSALQGRAADRDKKSPYNIETMKKGTSSRSALKEAKRVLPLNQLMPAQRKRAEAILKSVSHFRQLPQLRFQVEPRVYQYFTLHPDAAVSIWRVMDISKFEMTETSPRVFEADAGDGSKGVSDILYQTPHECVLICDGIYKNPLLVKPITAKGLVHLTTAYTLGPDREPVVVHRASVFIAFPTTTLRTAARVISPITNTIMDRNFHEISVFLQMMSMAMERQPAWVDKIVSGMEGVDPERKPELMGLTRRIRAKATQRNLSVSMVDPISVEELTQPLTVLPLRGEAVAQQQSVNPQPDAPDDTGRVSLSSKKIPVRTASHRGSKLPVIIPRAVAESVPNDETESDK